MQKDGDLLEWTLTCIAYMFKALKRSLKRNISQILPSMLPLMSEETPIHIVNFMAECFAFIIRDLGKKAELFKLIFASIDEKHIVGCSRVIFEILRGVGGQLHVEAKSILSTLIEFLRENQTQYIFPVFVQITTDVVDCLKKQSLLEYAKFLTQTLKELINNYSENVQPIHNLLNLWGQMVENSKESLQMAIDDLIHCIFSLFENDVTDETLQILSKLCQVLLSSSKLTISQTEVTRLCKKCMSIRTTSIVAQFVDAMKTNEVFDTLIMSDLLKYVTKITTVEAMEMLASTIIDKGGFWRSGIEMEDNERFPSYAAPDGLSKSFLDILTVSDQPLLSDEAVLALICLPHVTTPKNMKQVFNVLKNISSKVAERLSSHEHWDVTIFTLHLLCQGRLRCHEMDFTSLLLIVDKLQTVPDFHNNASILRLIDLLLTAVKQEQNSMLTTDLLAGMAEKLTSNLSSPVPEIRLLTTHILCQFNKHFPTSNNKETIYDIFYQIESVNIDVFNYREIIVKMDCLRPNTTFIQNLDAVAQKQDIVRFLLGILFRNFKLLWEPTASLIISYSEHINSSDFWQIFKEQLEKTSTKTKVETDEENKENNPCVQKSELNAMLFKSLQETNDDADLFNCHYLLWNCLSRMPSICDTKNREIVPMYLEFYEATFKTKQQ